MPFIRERIGLSYTQTSYLQTTRTGFYLLGMMVTDKLFTKLGLRNSCMIAFVLTIAGGLLYGSATSFLLCALAAMCMGMGNGIGGAMPSSILVYRWFEKKQGLAHGICTAGNGIPTIVFAAPFAMLIREKGVLFGYGTYEIIVAVGAVIFFLLVRNYPADKGLLRYGEGEETDEKVNGESKPKKKHTGPIRPLSKVDTVLLYVMVLFISIMVMCGWNFFSVAATGVGYDPVFAAAMMSLNNVMGLIARPLYGIACDRWKVTTANILLFIPIVIGHIFLGLMDGVNQFYVYAGCIILGFCAMTPSYVGFPIWAGALSDEKNYTKTLKNMRSFSSFASLFMMPIAGMVADRFGSYRPVFFFIAGTILIPLFIINYLYKRYSPVEAPVTN